MGGTGQPVCRKCPRRRQGDVMIYALDGRTKAKWDIVRSADDLADAIARLTGAESPLPESGGLGTDGTCWTDDEIRDWLAAFFRNANKTLRKRADRVA